VPVLRVRHETYAGIPRHGMRALSFPAALSTTLMPEIA
jgi:hypothetical protein